MIKQSFFIALMVGVPFVLASGALIYLFWNSFSTLYENWQLGRELEEIRAYTIEKRRKEAAEKKNAPPPPAEPDASESTDSFPAYSPPDGT